MGRPAQRDQNFEGLIILGGLVFMAWADERGPRMSLEIPETLVAKPGSGGKLGAVSRVSTADTETQRCH